jgi:hypothetical protein
MHRTVGSSTLEAFSTKFEHRILAARTAKSARNIFGIFCRNFAVL